MGCIRWLILSYKHVVSIKFSSLSSVELTNSWYQLHNEDYTVMNTALVNNDLPMCYDCFYFYKTFCPYMIVH